LEQVELTGENSAVVQFKSMLRAFLARQQVNGKFLLKKRAYVKVEWQIAKRIIGPKGFNMKKIVDACSHICERSSDRDRDKEAVKLRLRGKGSGYKENDKKEICEPLHLCVSSKFPET